MIKVLIADDHQIIRDGLRKLVFHHGSNIEVVGEASSGSELMSLLKKSEGDILILDITMPDKNGIDLIKDIREQYPELPILVLSMHPEERFAVRALKAGASGYLNKTCSSHEMVDAVNKIVVNKRKYISLQVAEQLALQMDDSTKKQPHEELSDREYQVLCMIASGKKVADIAVELKLSTQTVHTYRTRIKEKMNIKTNVDLAKYAMIHGLID